MDARVLVIDDEETMCQFLAKKLARTGCTVQTTTDPRTGLEQMRQDQPDVVLTDLVMSGVDGLEVVRTARALARPPQVIVMTAYATVQTAVEAMRLGAFDYITKPFTPDEIVIVLERALRDTQLTRRVAQLEAEVARCGRGEIIGRSSVLRKVLEQVERFAGSDGIVLITGETGTGKELVARELHRRSARGAGPFIAVNCAAVPEALLEAELFGHEQGAFTGALRTRHGLVEQAHGGTLFLDELGDAPLTFQATLLRFLETHAYRRVGGETERRADVRVLCATHRDLKGEIARGRFREDLYYRVHALVVALPPLRYRQEDIPLLARHFLERHRSEQRRALDGIEPGAMKVLLDYPWPGNVRELDKVIERGVAVCDGKTLRLADLPPELKAPAPAPAATGEAAPPGPDYERAREEFERAYFQARLSEQGGNVAAVARVTGLDYSTVQRKLKRYLLP